MDKTKKVFILILVLTLGAVLVDMPKSIQFPGWKFTRPVLFGRNLDIKEGLDLAGGTQLTLQADMSAIPEANRQSALDSLQSIIERRVNPNGIFEPVIQTSRVNNDYRINIELPGVSDVQQALDLVGQTANLTFQEEASDSAIILTGRDLQKATPSFDQKTSSPIIQLVFNDEGAKKFEDITKRNIGKRVAILLDGQVLMAPTVQTVISDGTAQITGQFTAEQTKQMALLLNSGALPAPVKVIQQRTIGATLGQDSINKSLVAGLVGLGIVAFFMIANYGRLGVLADFALIIYSLVVFAIFKLVPVTLTLAGIAGFILSIGMAVDANILIFERMREEIRWGRNKLAAMELGFTRAFPSIRDSNANSLIVCAVLYSFGTGAVRGFAVTLAIGIVVSLFTAVVVTRTFLRLAQKYV